MKKRKIAIIAGLLVAIIVSSFITLFSKTKTQLNEVALQDGKQNLTTQSTITYDEVKSGDSDVYYTNGDSQVKVDNFELDAYFIEDNKKVRGVTKYLSETPNLNMVVNASQFVNLTIKNLKATVSSNKIFPTCTTSAEGIIKQVSSSTVYFNDFQGGSNTTINFSIKENVDTNGIYEDFSGENTVTFEGTCEYIDASGSTVSYPFKKVVDFTVDWTGNLDLEYHYLEKYSNDIIATEDKIIVSIAVHTKQVDGDADRLINKQADYTMSNLAINGVKPIDVQASTLAGNQYAEYNYDKTKDVFTFSQFLTQGYLPYGYNSVINVIYPRSELEATINNEIITKQYSVKAKIKAIGNKNISYNNNPVFGIAETEEVEATLNIDIRDFNGKIIDFTNRLDDVNKFNTRLAYSKNGMDTSLYEEVWRIKIALGNYYERLEIERNNVYNDGKDSSCFFDGTNNVFYSMDDCKSYRGFLITEDIINSLGGEDNTKIMVYSVDDSGVETRITRMKHTVLGTVVDTVKKAGDYIYVDEDGNEVTYKKIKFVITTESTTRTIGVGDYWIGHYMKIDNNVVKNTYNIDTFDKFTQVHSSTKISGDSVDTSKVEYIMPASAGADYVDGTFQYGGTPEVKLDVRNENSVSYVIDLNTIDKYFLQYINDPSIILELPEQFTSVDDVELKGVEDRANILTVDTSNPPQVLKQNGRIIIKAKFKGVVQSDLAAIVIKMNLNVPEDEVTTSMPEADIRAFIYSDILDGTGIVPRSMYGYRAGKEQDIYDIDKDGNTTELQFIGRTKVLYLTPSGMETYTSVKATVDGKVEEEKCPNVLGVVPNKINKATIDVDLYLFYLDTTISNLKIVGRIPYVDNTFVLDNAQDNLGSTFNTTMTSAGIKVPDDIKNYTTVYYSTSDATIKKGTATTVNTSVWKTKEQVTDWSKIKSYLIVVDNAITNDRSMNMSTFSYDINLPTEQKFGEKAYATHAVEYVSKVGDSNEELMQTETNKVGISFVTDTPISVYFTKSENDKATLIKGAKYELSNFVEGEEIDVASDGTLIYTKQAESIPRVAFDNLYTGIKYKLTEKEAPAGYEKHDPIVFEIKMDSDGNYYVEIDESNSAKNVVDVTAQKYEQNSTTSYISGVYLIEERSNANYKVKYFYENPDGTYTEKAERAAVTRSAKIGTSVSVEDNDKNPVYDEYELEDEHTSKVYEGTVLQDGSLVLKVYFKLKNANYRVEYYYQMTDGSYVQKAERPAATRSDKIGKTVEVTTDDKKPVIANYVYDSANASNVLSGTVAKDNSLTLKLYFNLQQGQYKVQYYYQNADGTYAQRADRKEVTIPSTVGSQVAVTEDDKEPKFDTYEYESTNSNNVLTGTVTDESTLTLKVYFKLKQDKYRIEYYYENQDGSYSMKDTRPSVTRTGTLGETVSANAEDKLPNIAGYEYISTNSNHFLSGKVVANGGLTLKVYFNLKGAKYTVRYYYQNVDGSYAEKAERKAVERTSKVGAFVSVTDDDRNPKFDIYEFENGNTNNVLNGTVTEDNKFELKLYFKLRRTSYNVEYYYENSNGSYSQREDRPSETRPGTIGDKVAVTTEDKDPKFDEYDFASNNSKNVLEGTLLEEGKLTLKVYFNLKQKQYTVEYYYQNANGTYTQRQDRKAETRTGKVYEIVNVTNDDKKPVFENYEFEITHESNVLSDTLELNKDTTLKLYFKLMNKQYTVEYYYEQEDGSYKQRADRKTETRSGKIGNTVSASDEDKNPLFNNYQYESSNPNNVLNDTLEVNKTTTLKVYFKFKKATYKVEYYYENTDGTFSQRQDRAPRIAEGTVDAEVSVINTDKDPVFNNYVYDSTNEGNVLTGTVLEGNGLVLKVYFKFKKANYTVEYYYQQDDGSFKQIAERAPVTRVGIVDSTEAIIEDDKDPKNISYEFDKENRSNVLSGTVTEDNGLKLKVYFRFNKANYKVEYYYQNADGKTYSQRSDRQPVVREGIVGREVAVIDADKVSGFTYYSFEDTHADNKLSGTVTDDNGLVLKVYFKLKKAQYTVTYYYEQENGGYEQRADRPVVTREGLIDHEVSVIEEDKDSKLNHYVFETDNENNVLSGTVTEDNSLALKVYFKFKKANYRVQYYYENRDGSYSQREDRPEVTRVGIVDFEVNVIDQDKDPLKNNYVFESDHAENKLSGIVLENNGLVLKVYFKFKIANYTVEYYYENKDGSYNKIATRPDVVRSGIVDDIAEVTTDDKDPRNEYYTFANEHNGNILSGTILEGDGLVLKVHFRLKKIIYNLDLNKQQTTGDTLAGTKFSVYLDDATTPMFDNKEVTSAVELKNQVLYMGEYDLWITENSTAGDPYINILDGKYIRIRMTSTTDEKFVVVGSNNNGNDDFFEVYESDKVTRVTDREILKWIEVIVNPETNTLAVTIKNPIQYNVNVTTVDTLNTFIQGNAYSVYRNESLLCTENVTTEIERNEYLMSAGTYDYYFTQNNLKDRYINILNGKFVKVTVNVGGDGKLHIIGAPRLFEGSVGDANAKEITAPEITKYITATVNNNTAISSLELHVVYPVTFNVEVDKFKTDNTPLENTEIKISSPIINDQKYVYDNEQISGIDSITADGTVTGTTDYVIDEGTQARVSYAETYVHANANGYYTYEITEVTPAGGQYVNILEGYKVVLRIKVSGDGELTLVDENGNPYAENVAKRFTIVATGDKAVTEDLYDYVFIGIDNNTVKAVLNADVINPIRYKMAVHQSLYGTDGRVKIVNMPVKVNGSDLTNKTIEKSPVWATEKVVYKVTQENPVVDNGLINVLDGYYIGVDINIPGDGDIKTIASNGDKTTNSYRIYKADGTEVNFNQTHIDDFVRVQITKDNNNVCTVNIYVEVPQEFDVKLQKIDADTKEALNDVEFSMVAKYEGNEIKLKDITKNSDQILTNYLKTAKVDGEYGIIKLNNILIEKAGKYTFVLTENTPDPKPEYRYKDKKGDMVIDFEVAEGNGRYVIKNIKTNNAKYSEGQVGSDNLVKLTVKNERITGVYGVEITKISELLGLPIQGSEFSIRAYKKNADGEDVDVTFYNNVVKTENTQVVPGTIDINSENGINNYKIMIENTDKHFLEIKETKAPDTYTKLAEPIVLKVTPKLVGEYDDAKYVIDTIDFISGKNENLVKLVGYEDEKIKLEIKNNQFDLSLRQYVSSINGVDVSRWNSPEIDTSKLITGEDTTAEYYNNKMPLRIFAGQEVIYTFRVYNEGQINGYANEIVAYLPEQLEFLKDDEFNTSRNWEIVELDDETSYLTAIKTNFLSREVSEDNLIEAFDHIFDDISYREVQVKCKIKDDEEPRQTVTTLAEITKFEAPTRPDAIDRDSNQPLELPAEEELPEYKYKAENENGYVAGDEDDDDFEKVRIEKFDLATEKFVTSINNQEVKDTEPSFKVDKDGNHINYTKTNEDLKIANGNTVEYTIRVYNQGTIDAYADVIEEELPKELIFDRKNPINTKYGWIMLDENRNQTDDISKVKYLSTNYLSKSQGENQMTEDDLENPNLLKDFDRASMESPDYRDVKVALIANLPTEKEGELVNIARVKSGTDSEGMTLKDEEPQNDASDEKINIVYFDLSISKWITETVTYLDGKETVDATGFEGNKEDYPLVKIDVKKSKIDDAVIKIKYNIKVTNEGSVPGYAKEITDYIPDGLKLDPADNPNWTLQGNNAVTTELQDKLLAPGETATVSITLTWVNLKENVGLKVNAAEITKDYNEQGDTKDIDSIPGNKVFEEDDLSDTCKMLISIKTGEEQRYTLLIIAVGTIIGIGVISIKKYVLS